MKKSLADYIKDASAAAGPLRLYRRYYRAAWVDGEERKFCDHQHRSEFYALECGRTHKSEEVVVVENDVQRELTLDEKIQLERGWSWPSWRDDIF